MRLTAAFTMAIVVGMAAFADASPVTFNFAATVQTLSATELATLGLSLGLGDTLNGSFQYDPALATADGRPDSTTEALYGFDVPGAFLNWSTQSFAYAADGTPFRMSGSCCFPDPSFAVYVGPSATLIAASAVFGGQEYQTALTFFGAPIDDSLPLSLANQNVSHIGMYVSRIYPGANGGYVGSPVFSAYVTPLAAGAPEPSQVVLTGTGLLLLALARSRRPNVKRSR